MIPSLFPSDFFENYSYGGLYPGAAGNLPPHGDVDLVDCIDCYAEQNEDDCSEWELAFTYPVNGQGFDKLKNDNLVSVKANSYQNNQFFRIYSVEKRTEKSVLVKAQHISYDMNNIPVKPFKLAKKSDGQNPERAINKLISNAYYGQNNTWKRKFPNYVKIEDASTFRGWETSKDEFEFEDPISMRALLLDGDNSIKGTYGGDLIFNNYLTTWVPVGGENRGVTIEYGVDLIDMDQEDNISEMITTILPYYKRSNNDPNYESEPIIYGDPISGPGTYKVPKIVSVDLSEHFPNDIPDKNDINAKARQYVRKEKIGEPEVTLTVSYAKLGQDVRIHDQINVKFPALGITTSAKVVRYRFNVLTEKCEEIDVGHAKSTKLFNLMDASKLKKGLVPPERIKNESITNKKLGRGSVGKGKIAPRTVQTKDVELGAINHELLKRTDADGEGGAVQTDVISKYSVTSQKLNRGSVTEEKIDTGAVTNTKIGRKAVTGGNNGKIADNTITTGNTNSGINTSLAEADNYAAATVDQTSVYPWSFKAGFLSAVGGVYVNGVLYTFKEVTIDGVTIKYLGTS